MPSPFLPRARAYAVHLLTASGVVAAFLAVAELADEAPDERVVFAWLVLAVMIDAVDGSLARAWDVKRFAPELNGRTIDDIVDYLTSPAVPDARPLSSRRADLLAAHSEAASTPVAGPAGSRGVEVVD